MMKKGWKLLVYLAGYLILTTALAIAQPLSDGAGLSPPDEGSRYLVPQYIYTHGELPTGLETETRIPGYGFSYMLYNAFPYIIMGLAMWVTGLFTADPTALLMTARMVNVLAGLGMAYVVYLLGGVLFRRERDRWLFRLAVTFQPMNLFIHSYVNTDSFCMLSTALIVYGLVLLRQKGPGTRICVLLAGGISLCALSYYSAYGYILAAMVLFCAAFIGEKGNLNGRFDRKGFLKYAGLTAGLVLAGIGWWFIRQGIVLDGDFLGLRTREAQVASYGIPEVQKANTFAGRGYSFFRMIGEMIRGGVPGELAVTLVAAYGSMTIRPGSWFYAAYLLIWTAGAVGCIVMLLRDRGRKRGWRWWLFHGCMAGCIVLPFILYLKYCYEYDYQVQGRYLLPGLIPAMMYMTKGIGRLNGQAVYGCAAAIGFLAVWLVCFVALPALA